VADAHGLAHDDGTTRAELISRIADRLTDATYLAEQLERLSTAERGILASAHASGGELRVLLVDAEQPGAAEDLARRGWLYRVFSATGPLRGEVLVVPEELLAVLPSEPEANLPRLEREPPQEPRWTDPAFSLFALTSALTRQGGNREDELSPWSQEPGGWDWSSRWTFLEHLATHAGLLGHNADGKLSPAPTLARLLDEPPLLAERIWRAYLRDRSWSELRSAELASEDDLVDGVALRQAVADVLDQLPEAAWLSWSALADWLRLAHPKLVREQLTPRGLVRFQAASWDELERPLLRYFCLGPLYWLGHVAASRDGTLVSRRPRPRQIQPEACRWDEPADLIAPASARLGLLLQAERYLVLRERGRVSRYHLVQAHVAAALGGGGSVAECQALLRELTQGPLPGAVTDRLEAWERRFGALEIRPAVLLEARSAADLDAALAHEEVRPFVRARLSEQVAEVAAADALELAAALRGSDHLPRIDAALRLAADARRAYSSLVDEQVLEFLLVSLLAFRTAWPERLAELEGSTTLLERLEHQFPPARLAELRADAGRLAGTLRGKPVSAPKRRRRRM
jgi:hypothetical protein